MDNHSLSTKKQQLHEMLRQGEVQSVIKMVLEMKDDSTLEWLEHLFFPFSRKVARLPSMFSPSSHVFNEDFTVNIGGNQDVCVIYYPQRVNTGSLLINNTPVNANSWNVSNTKFYSTDFKKMRLTGAGMTYEYIGSEQYCKGYAYQSVQYGLFSTNFNSGGRPTVPITPTLIQDSDYYSGRPLSKTQGGYVRFMPKDDIEFFKYHDVAQYEAAEDGDNDNQIANVNYSISDPDIALVFFFEGLPTNEGNVIKLHFTRGFEALPHNDKQDQYCPSKIRGSKIFKQPPIQQMASGNKSLVSSTYSRHPDQSIVKQAVTRGVSNVSGELDNIMSMGKSFLQDDGFRSMVTMVNPEAGLIMNGLNTMMPMAESLIGSIKGIL